MIPRGGSVVDHRDRKLGVGHAREPHTEVPVYLCMFVCEGVCVLVCVCARVSVRMEGRGQEGEMTAYNQDTMPQLHVYTASYMYR